MRKLLLEDPAVMDVELALVPDADYRADVQRAQFRRPDLGFKAGGSNGKKPGPGVIPAIAGTLGLPPPPDARRGCSAPRSGSGIPGSTASSPAWTCGSSPGRGAGSRPG